MRTSSTCNSILPAVTDRSPRSTSCSKTRTTSSEPAPKAAPSAVRLPERTGAARIECGGRDEMDGQPKGRECGMQSSQVSPRKRCDIDNAKRWAPPENREDRVNHLIPQP